MAGNPAETLVYSQLRLIKAVGLSHNCDGREERVKVMVHPRSRKHEFMKEVSK